MNTQRSFGYALIGMMSLIAALQGCSDDKDANDKPPVVTPTAGKSASGGSDGENGGAAGNPNSAGKAGSTANGGTGAEGGEPTNPVGGAGGEGGVYEPECLLPEKGADGCFNCPKNGQIEQWLNRCVDSECEPFDNSRLPLLKADGSLPPLH